MGRKERERKAAIRRRSLGVSSCAAKRSVKPPWLASHQEIIAEGRQAVSVVLRGVVVHELRGQSRAGVRAWDQCRRQPPGLVAGGLRASEAVSLI